MTPVERLVIRTGCEELVYRAMRYTDVRAWEELAALFTEHGRLIRPSDRANPIVGRDAILASLATRPPAITRHLVSNVLIDILSPTSAHVSSVVVLLSGTASAGSGVPEAKKMAIGNFEDDVILTDAGWAFVCRDGSMALQWNP